jgi:hypothetical protein
VVELPEDQKVPAEGVVAYRYVTVDPHIDHDVWVQRIEIRPSARAVTHHVMAFLVPPGVEPMNALNNLEDALGTLQFAASVPGGRPIVLEDGHGKFVRAGSKFLFQLHYAPNGKAAADARAWRWRFSRVPVTWRAKNHAIIDDRINIAPPSTTPPPSPPSTPSRSRCASLRSPPHACAARSFRLSSRRKGAPASILLDVPKYDFNWQHDYRFGAALAAAGRQARRVTRPSRQLLRPHNPDPKKRVGWGDQTFEEMLVGFISFDVDAAAHGVRAPEGGSPR